LHADIGTLRVYTGLLSGSVAVWNQTGSAGNFWQIAQINVTTTTSYSFIFDVDIGNCLLVYSIYAHNLPMYVIYKLFYKF